VAEDGAGDTDEDMMQKAMRRKAAKNLDTAGTKQSSTSFTAFSDSHISSNLGRVDVSMGRQSDEISVSVNVLRHMERGRLTVMPKAFTELESSFLEEDETDGILDG
jgi:ribosome-binding protein aMBF1 (putative translation factor)